MGKIFPLMSLVLLSAIVTSCNSAQEESASADNLMVEAAPRCSKDALPALADVRITSVTVEAAPAPHCKVAGVIGTETNFELLLPDNWNSKFAMGGGGGFVGFVVNTALMYGALQSGYATVGTDTGHQGHPLDASWALNNIERIVSFGHQAVHRTAVTAKAFTAAYYGEAISRSYFTGCSRGGGQALMEAQRYPEDFDGIVAGAPAYNWTHLGARNTWINQAMYPDPNDLSLAVIGPDDSALIAEAIREQCDNLDGLEDGIYNDPLQCDFEVASLACDVGETDACLTNQKIAAAKRIYDDLYIQGERIFPGFPVGGEASPGGWLKWLTGGLSLQEDDADFQEGVVAATAEDSAPVTPTFHFAFGNGIMKYFVFHDPDWNYADYTFETFESDVAAVAPTLNATNPGLSAFRERDGKLLMYTGWADMALSPLETIEYYENVLEHDASAAEDVRLIMMPGVDHCFGGVGPPWVNYLDEIDKWVETGDAPEQMTAYWLNEQMQPDGSRPVCAYPNYVKYNGTGDSRDASNFSCVGAD